MIKTFPFRLDIEKEYNNRMYSVNSNDLKTVKFTFVVTDNGIPLDLVGLTVRIAIRKPDKKAVWQDCTVTNAPKGEVEVILDNQAYIKKGEHEAELMLYKGTNTVAITQKFHYRAAEGIMSDKSLKSETVLGPIDQKLAEVEETLKDIRDNGTGIDAKARQDIESVTTQLAEMPTKEEVNALIGNISNGTPLFASTISGMTDRTRLYVNTTDGLLYVHNGTTFVSTGRQYQSTGVAEKSITPKEVSFTKESTNLFDVSKILLNKIPDSTTGNLNNSASNHTSIPYNVKGGDVLTTRGVQHIAAYGVNGSFVSRTYIPNLTNAYNYTVPANAVMVRFVIVNDESAFPKNQVQVNKGNVLLPFESYYKPYLDKDVLEVKELPKNIVRKDNIIDRSISKEKTDFINISSNLFDTTKIIKHASVDATTGKIVFNSNGHTSVLYPIEPGETRTTKGVQFVSFYDNNNNFITRLYFSNVNQANTFIVPNNAVSVRYTIPTENNATSPFPTNKVQVNKGGTLLSFESFYKPYSNLVPNTFYIPEKVGAYDVKTITVEQMYEKYDELIEEFPYNFSKTVLGRDASNTYDIWEIVYKPLEPCVPKVKILIEANMHGDSSGGDPKDVTIVLYELLKAISKFDGRNEALTYLKYNVELHVIPISNPWGYDNNQRHNSNNVDLNRDFTTNNPSPQAETTILMNWMDANLDADLFWSLHAMGSGNTSSEVVSYFTTFNHELPHIILNEVGKYLSQRQNNTFTVIQAVEGMTAYYADTIKGFPAFITEYPVYTNPHHAPHSAEMFTDYLEWYGNILYRYALRF